MDSSLPPSSMPSPSEIHGAPSEIQGADGLRESGEVPASVGALVLAARAGDVRAFERLVLRYESRVRAVALAAGLDREAAEDVAQETFVAAHAGLASLEDPASFPSWLAGIARHRALSILRKAPRPTPHPDLDRLPLPEAHEEPLQAALRAALKERIARAFAALGERERFALALHHHAGLTYAEIAETMTLPLTTIKGLLYRGTRELRDRLAGLAENARGDLREGRTLP